MMRLRMRRGRTGAGRAVCGALLVCSLSGCGSISGYAYSVESRFASIVFGAATHARVIQQPTAVPAPAPVPVTTSIDQFPSQDFGPPPDNTFTIPVAPRPKPLCPPAPDGAAAEEKLTATSLAPPQPGAYKFVTQYITTAADGTRTVGPQHFETRYIYDVSPDNPQPSKFAASQTIHQYTFNELLPDPSGNGGLEILSFAVHSYSDINNPPQNYGGNSDPDGGLSLTEITRVGASGYPVIESWKPQSHVLLLDYPVLVGNNGSVPPSTDPNGAYTWDFTGVDTSNQWSLELAGQADAKAARVDTCGSIVNGWSVLGNVTMIKKDPTSGVPFAGPLHQTWHFDVAPQRGSLVLLMEITGDNPSGTSAAIQTEEKLGSLTVGPLPAKPLPEPA